MQKNHFNFLSFEIAFYFPIFGKSGAPIPRFHWLFSGFPHRQTPGKANDWPSTWVYSADANSVQIG
jgi:hypothetical protein